MAAVALHDSADMEQFSRTMSVEPQSGAVGDVKHVAWQACPSSQLYTDLSSAGTFLKACSPR